MRTRTAHRRTRDRARAEPRRWHPTRFGRGVGRLVGIDRRGIRTGPVPGSVHRRSAFQPAGPGSNATMVPPNLKRDSPALGKGVEHVPARVQDAVEERARRRDHAALTPARNDAFTRASTVSERRSASKRATSSPSVSARAHRCGSSSRPWSANSASCIAQNAPCSPAASAAHAAGQARGCEERTGKWRKHTRTSNCASAHVQHRAERALVVAVDDHQPALPRARGRDGPTGGSGAEPRSLRARRK